MRTGIITPVTWSDHAQGALRSAGLKPGGARSAVVEVLAEQPCCLPASEIHDRVRARRPGVGIASVYRALETLTALGLVHRIDLRSGGARYEPAEPSGDHHHHLVCGDCGRVEAFTDDRLERAIQTISQGASFRVDEHDVVLRGRCDACA
ncbi:MAG TPA: Fur family transcriptional regulator [Gaiellaceae bacterium]|nr:Fur family transcriptional regulator [Gaiellaceae bacterium]